MNARNLKALGFLIHVVLLLTACNVVRGSDDLVTESRNVSDFNSVSPSGSGNIQVDDLAAENLIPGCLGQLQRFDRLLRPA